MVLLLLLPVALAGQARFSARVSVVSVDVLVTERGRPVTNLTAADFELLDEGVPQRIDRVAGSEVPLDVWLVFDTTRSLEGVGLQHLIDAGQIFVRALGEDDRVALLTFAEQPVLAGTFEKNHDRALAALAGLRAHGATSLHDAVYAALAVQEPAATRRLLLVFSDGRDNSSWLTEAQVQRVAATADTVTYAVVPQPQQAWSGPRRANEMLPDLAHERFLQSITDETGGEFIRVGATRDLSRVFRRILDRMKARYMLSYYPEGVSPSGWHRLEVRVKGRRASVQARRGYFAGPSS